MKHIFIIFLSFLSIVLSQNSVRDINNELDKIKSELKESIVADVSEIDTAVPTLETVILETDVASIKSTIFGYDYFKRDINFFDNIPTPRNYKLGPGDTIMLSTWGEYNSQKSFVINKNGSIFYENLGFINLANKTIEDAETILKIELSKIYETINNEDNPTQLMLELEKLKSINVYFTGEILSPGIHLLHPFSDIFTAIVQAGGISEDGSLRNIQLIRNGNIVSTVDFYSFFMDGKNNFSNTKIIDGDVIHIPGVTRRVSITGAVNREGYYELLEGESAKTLIEYALGFTSEASSSAIINKIIPQEDRTFDDNARTSQNIDIKNFESVFLNDGDNLTVSVISDVASKVQVFGRVKNPGEFSAINSSLRHVLDMAGGFNDPIFRKSIRDDNIIILRKDDSQFYGLEFNVPYSESSNFELKPEDKIFVYEDSKYNNLSSIQVIGEVNKRGYFKLKDGMTVKDAIDLAEGFSPLANKNGIIVSEKILSTNGLGEIIETTNQVNSITLDFQPPSGSIINVLPLENIVRVQGNVYNPGPVAFVGSKSVRKYINLAGGKKPNTISNRIYVKRANGRIKKVALLGGLGVFINPGDTIFVPVDPTPNDFDVSAFIADLASTLANIAAILIIVERQ